MKILLIIPTFNYAGANFPNFLSVSDFPTGFAYLAASLKEAGHEVVGLNLNNKIGYPSARAMIQDLIPKAIEEYQPGLIGVGGICTDYAFLKGAIGIIRQTAPHVPIVLGGGIVNNDAEFIFRLLCPDFCIVGEGEETIVKLANGEPHESINNLGYWQDGQAVFTAVNYQYRDIDNRPFPDYKTRS